MLEHYKITEEIIIETIATTQCMVIWKSESDFSNYNNQHVETSTDEQISSDYTLRIMTTDTQYIVTECPPSTVQETITTIKENNADELDVFHCTAEKVYKNKTIADCHGVDASPMEPLLSCEESIITALKGQTNLSKQEQKTQLLALCRVGKIHNTALKIITFLKL